MPQIQAGTRIDPELKENILLKIDALMGHGDYDEAFKLIGKLHSSEASFSVLTRLAEMYQLTGQSNAQLQTLREAQAAYSGENPEPAAWIQTRIGISHLENDRDAEAEIAFMDALAFSPDYYLALEHLAELYRKQGNLAAARDYLQRTIRIARNPEFLLRLAAIETEAGNAELALPLEQEADEILEQQAAKDPAAHARDLLERLIAKGDRSARLMDLVKADLAVRPGDLRSNFIAARVCRLLGDIDCAEKHIAQTLRLGTKNAEYTAEAALIESETKMHRG
jgi:tetratricopeptide (TPR) repeat protein